MSFEQQAHFIELGKQLQEKEALEKRFNENLKTLEDKFTEDTTDVKLKVSNITKQTIPEIIEYIQNSSSRMYGYNEIYYILYAKMLKYKLKKMGSEIQKFKDEISDLEGMNSGYIEELDEFDVERKKLQSDLKYYRDEYNYMFYFLVFSLAYLAINFISVFLFGIETYSNFWITIVNNLIYISTEITNIIIYYYAETSIILISGYCGYQVFLWYKKNYMNPNIKED